MSRKIMTGYPIEYHRLRHGRRALTLEFWANEQAGTVLFYPGTMLSPFQYRTLLAALHRNGLAVAALHLTGHGCNPHWLGFTFEDLLQDGLEAEDWLLRHDHGPLIVCGHSQGGILTLAHAASSRRPLAAFPITGILPQQKEAIGLTIFKNWERQKLQKAIVRSACYLPHLPIPLPAYLSLRRVCANARRIHTAPQKRRLTYPLAFLASLFTAHIPTKMHCPVYLFNARDDALFTQETARRTLDLLQAPHKEIISLPKGGHLAVFDPRLCQFLARQISSLSAGLGLDLHLSSKGKIWNTVEF